VSKADLLIKNARVATDYTTFEGGVLVQDGKITQVFEGPASSAAQETLDLGGKLLMPGVVDSHQHLNEPGRADWEGYAPGSRASAAGGITTVLEMPFNAYPPTRNVDLLEKKRQAVRDQSVIDYGHWALLENSNLGDLEGLHRAGAVAFKGFMCDPGEFEMVGNFELLEAMEIVAKLGGVIGLHAEDEALAQGFTRRMKAAGRADPRAWAEGRPPVVELEALQRAVALAVETGCRVHMVHTTIPEGFDAIQRARLAGAKVTGEACPHYLALDEDDLARLGPTAKCGPPLRQRKIVDKLWDYVLNGQVDVIGSDHSPCPVELKQAGEDDIWKAWGGMNSSQMMLPVLLTEGVHKRGLPLEALVRLVCLNPARLFGLYPAKGHLWPGADADLTVVDLDAEWTLSTDMLFSRHKISPYAGRTFKGKVLRTILRGQTIFQDGEVTAQPGYGELVTPAAARQFAG
jgi:allantoinase